MGDRKRPLCWYDDDKRIKELQPGDCISPGVHRWKVTITDGKPSYTVLEDDEFILVETDGSGNRLVYLPEIDEDLDGKQYIIKRRGARWIKVKPDPSSSDSIDNDSYFRLNNDYEAVTLMANYASGEWWII